MLKNEIIKILEEVYKENPERIIITDISTSPSPYKPEKISEIQILEKSIKSVKDYYSWQERITIEILNNDIDYYKDGKPRKFEEILKEIKKAKLRISICAYILKKIKKINEYNYYLVRLFNKNYILKTKLFLKEKLYQWFIIFDESEHEYLNQKNAEIIDVKSKEIDEILSILV